MNDKENYIHILQELEGITDDIAEMAQELLKLECTCVNLQKAIYQLFQEGNA